jgi:hypothetical protein
MIIYEGFQQCMQNLKCCGITQEFCGKICFGWDLLWYDSSMLSDINKLLLLGAEKQTSPPWPFSMFSKYAPFEPMKFGQPSATLGVHRYLCSDELGVFQMFMSSKASRLQYIVSSRLVRFWVLVEFRHLYSCAFSFVPPSDAVYSKVQRLLGTKRPLSVPPEELLAEFDSEFGKAENMADPSQLQQLQLNQGMQGQMMAGSPTQMQGVSLCIYILRCKILT